MSAVVAARTRAQLLAGRRPRDVASAVSAVLAVQAQDTGAARLAVRARTRGLVAADVDSACAAEPVVVRTWLMRGTLHMVATADVRWLLGLLGPVFAAAGRRRREQLGLDSRSCARGLDRIRRTLTGSAPLTRADLFRRMGLDPGGQAPYHLLGYAAMTGLICRGPEAERDEPTYVLLDDWVPAAAPVPREEALARLADRYLAAYGPATVDDFRTWSGLGAAATREAFGALSTVDSRRSGRGRGAGPAVRLLGAFDPYLLGYRSRDFTLDPAYARRIQAGGGMIRPAVLVDGQVVGTWRQRRTGDRLAIQVEAFGTLSPKVRDLLAADAADIGRFLGLATVFGSAENAAG